MEERKSVTRRHFNRIARTLCREYRFYLWVVRAITILGYISILNGDYLTTGEAVAGAIAFAIPWLIRSSTVDRWAIRYAYSTCCYFGRR